MLTTAKLLAVFAAGEDFCEAFFFGGFGEGEGMGNVGGVDGVFVDGGCEAGGGGFRFVGGDGGGKWGEGGLCAEFGKFGEVGGSEDLCLGEMVRRWILVAVVGLGGGKGRYLPESWRGC